MFIRRKSHQETGRVDSRKEPFESEGGLPNGEAARLRANCWCDETARLRPNSMLLSRKNLVICSSIVLLGKTVEGCVLFILMTGYDVQNG